MSSIYKVFTNYIILIFLFVFFTSSANAENSDAIIIPGITKENVQDQNTLLPPNPLKLEAKWWSYFDVGNTLLASRIESFRSEFEKTISSFTAEERNSSEESIVSIRKILDVLVATIKENKSDNK